MRSTRLLTASVRLSSVTRTEHLLSAGGRVGQPTRRQGGMARDRRRTLFALGRARRARGYGILSAAEARLTERYS